MLGPFHYDDRSPALHPAIFAGIMTRTFSFLTDTGSPDIWVVDPQVQYIEDIKPLKDTKVLRVRGIEGVQWATGLFKGRLEPGLPMAHFKPAPLSASMMKP